MLDDGQIRTVAAFACGVAQCLSGARLGRYGPTVKAGGGEQKETPAVAREPGGEELGYSGAEGKKGLLPSTPCLQSAPS